MSTSDSRMTAPPRSAGAAHVDIDRPPGGGGWRRARSAPYLVALLVTSASLATAALVGNLVPLLGASLVVCTLAQRNSTLAVALARTVIVAFLVLSVIPIFGTLLGPLASTTATAAALSVATAVGTWRALSRSAGAGQWAWGSLAGPVVLLAGVCAYGIRFGAVPAWAMSGDARNHVLITGYLSSHGSWDFFYPAGYNAVAALLAGPHREMSPGATLTSAITLNASLLLLLVLFFGMLGGLVAAGSGDGPARELRAAAGSLISVSPLFLSALLVGGFHPISLAALLLLATTALIAVNPAGIGTCLFWSAAGGLAVLLTYPPAAPVVAAAACAWLGFGWRQSMRWRAVGAIGCAGFLVALLQGLRILEQRPDVVATVTSDGGIQHRHPLLLGVPVVIAALAWMMFRGRRQATVLAVVALSSASAGITVWWLIGLRGAIGYYAMKTAWVVASALLPLSLTRTGDNRRADRIFRSAVPAALLAVACSAPLLFRAVEAPVPAVEIARGWNLPSAQAAAVVPWLGDEGQGGLLWSAFEPEEDRRVDIWAAAYDFPEGSIDLNDPSATWAYGNDVAASTPFCTRLAAEPDFFVWTATPTSAAALAQVCGGFDDRIGVLPGDFTR